MKISHLILTGPEFVLPAMRVTQNKSFKNIKKPKLETWYKALITEHSPIRAANYRIYCEQVPYFVAMHFRTHHIGVQFYVGSQRLIADYDRGSLPQDALVNFLFDINAQGLINLARARLCSKSNDVTVKVMNMIKKSFENSSDIYDNILGRVLMRSCDYYGSCSELKPCRKDVESLIEKHENLLK